jgi:hypothetical protein
MTPPYVGYLGEEWQVGRCLYAPTPADVLCLADAVWHGICVDFKGLECCEEHKPIMATLARWIHPLESACGLPDAEFFEDINRCVVPWGDEARAMSEACVSVGVGSQ